MLEKESERRKSERKGQEPPGDRQTTVGAGWRLEDCLPCGRCLALEELVEAGQEMRWLRNVTSGGSFEINEHTHLKRQ